jgi:hypothetical protein
MIDKEAFKRISNGETPNNFTPSVQVLGVEKSASGYLLDLYDSDVNFQGLYLGSKLKDALDSNNISPSYIIRLQDYCFNQTVEVPLIIFEFEERVNSDLQIRPPKCETETKSPKYTPISELLSSARWELKVRVLDKQSIKDYRHSTDIGKYFKLIVIDSAGNQAEIVFFGAKVEEYFQMIQVSKIYSILQGIVSPPHPNYRKEGVLYEIRSTKETRVTQLEEDPDIPREAFHKNKEKPEPKGPIINECGVFEEVKHKEDFEKAALKKFIELSTFEQIRALKGSESKVMVYVLCTIGKLSLNQNENLWYQGCPNVKCKRKINVISFDKFFCQNCKKNYPNSCCRYRIMLPMHDTTGTYKVKIFDNYAETLLKISAQDLSYMSDVNYSKAESIVLALFGRKVIAELQITFSGSSKDVVLMKTRPAEDAYETLLADIDYIARISFP